MEDNMRGSVTLSQSTAEKIKQEIINGKFCAGDRLPNEQDLMNWLDVSRTTVREAVKILVSQNILRIEKGRGTYVHNNVGLVDDPFGLEFVPKETLIEHFQAFRDVNEPYVCYMATMNATDEELDEMESLLKKTEETIDKNAGSVTDREQAVREIAAHELAFHNMMYKMTHNVMYQRVLPTALSIVNNDYAQKLYSRGFQLQSCMEYHRVLFEAIRARDPEKALQKCREQCVEVWNWRTDTVLLEVGD